MHLELLFVQKGEETVLMHSSPFILLCTYETYEHVIQTSTTMSQHYSML